MFTALVRFVTAAWMYSRSNATELRRKEADDCTVVKASKTTHELYFLKNSGFQSMSYCGDQGRRETISGQD